MQRPAYNIRPPHLRRSWLQKAAQALLLALCVSGCSFGKDEEAAEMNTCQADADCSTQQCEAGRCVADVQSAVQVTVVVTPKRTPSGVQVQPIVSDSFELAGGAQTISLRLPVSIPVTVLHKGKPLAAQASFTPVDNQNLFTNGTTRLTLFSADKDDAPEANNATMLLEGMNYRVLIQPTDSSIPPHSLLFTATSGASLNVDYADFESKISTRTFVISNTSRMSYQVRAVAETTGAPISTTATLTGGIAGVASITLHFDDPDARYNLEFTPAEKQSYSTGVAGSCGDETPQPNLSVPSRVFIADSKNANRWRVEMPVLHPSVEYSGAISPCSQQKPTGDLQVSLITQNLYLMEGDSEAISGEYETAAAASWDAEASKFRFCARVPPGTYTVKVTPSPGMNCELFAEKRLVRPEWSGLPDELALRMPATLTANVLTPDRMPMPKATVDAIAFSAGELMRAPNDRSVANYNRSGSVATGADGSFTLSVDRGRYDVFVKPPANSNYAWRVLYDVAIAAAQAEFATEIVLSEPVAVTGTLNYIGGSRADQQSLADAEVHAYTLVDDESPDGGQQRSVEIGSGYANANGVVTLLLPPALQHSWNP